MCLLMWPSFMNSASRACNNNSALCLYAVQQRICHHSFDSHTPSSNGVRTSYVRLFRDSKFLGYELFVVNIDFCHYEVHSSRRSTCRNVTTPSWMAQFCSFPVHAAFFFFVHDIKHTTVKSQAQDIYERNDNHFPAAFRKFLSWPEMKIINFKIKCVWFNPAKVHPTFMNIPHASK